MTRTSAEKPVTAAERLIGIGEIRELTGRTTPTIYGWIKAGTFPKPRFAGRWSASEVDAALRGEPTATDDWKVDPNAIRECQAAEARNRKAKERRHVPRAVRGPKGSPLRLVADNPDAAVPAPHGKAGRR